MMVTHALPISQIYRTGVQPVKAQIITYAQEQDAAIDAEVLRAQSAESDLNAYITAVAIDAGATGAIVLWEPGTVDRDVVSLPVSPTANERVLNLTDKKLYQRMADNSDWMPPLTPAGGEQIYSRSDKLTRLFDTASWSLAQPMMPTVIPDSSNATVNRSAIQGALDNGGHVYVGGNGPIYIDGPLLVYSNTFLEINPNCILTLTGAMAGNMIQNAASQQAWTDVSVTWSAGLDVTVNWTSHGLQPGDYVSLEGVSLWCQADANGTATLTGTDINPITSGVVAGMLVVGPGSSVETKNTVASFTSSTVTANAAIDGGSPGTDLYYMLQTDPAFFETLLVESVTTNSFTAHLTQLPLVAPVGQMRARKADTNIKIRGFLDGNQRNGANSGTSGVDRMGTLFMSVQNLDLDLTIQDTVNYVVCTGGLRDARIGLNIPFNIKDGLKLFGPQYNCVVTHLSGLTNDDGVSLQPLSPPLFLADTQPNRGGSIKGVHAENLDIRGQGVFHTYGHPVFIIDNVGCNNVNSPSAVSSVPVTFDTNQDDMGGYYGRVYATNIYGQDLTTYPVGLVTVRAGTYPHVLVDGVSMPQISGLSSAAQGSVTVDTLASVTVLVAKDIVGGTPKNASCIAINGSCEKLIVDSPYCFPLDSNSRFVNIPSGGMCKTIELRGGKTGMYAYLVCQNPGALSTTDIAFFSHDSDCLTACFLNTGGKVMAQNGGFFNFISDAFVYAITNTASLYANDSVSVPTGKWKKTASGAVIVAVIDVVTAPANASSNGEAGMRAEDSGYLYYCTATNTWKRVAIATW